jgi:hypothetical protein
MTMRMVMITAIITTGTTVGIAITTARGATTIMMSSGKSYGSSAMSERIPCQTSPASGAKAVFKG